jgi:hypothetical protein
MARARFKHIETGKLFEADFEGAVYTKVVDNRGISMTVNCLDSEVVFVEHLLPEKSIDLDSEVVFVEHLLPEKSIDKKL